MVGAQVRSSGLRVQGPCWSRSAAGVSEVSEMARVCWRGLVGFGICDIHHSDPPCSSNQSQPASLGTQRRRMLEERRLGSKLLQVPTGDVFSYILFIWFVLLKILSLKISL
jgi:hypothetical protein